MSQRIPIGLFAAGLIVGGVFLVGAVEADPILGAERARTCELDREFDRVKLRNDAKDRIVARLIAGACSLEQATHEIQDVVGDDRVILNACRRAFPGSSDTEVFARHAIAFAAGRVSGAERGTLDRLKKDFEALYPLAPVPVSRDNSVPSSPVGPTTVFHGKMH